MEQHMYLLSRQGVQRLVTFSTKPSPGHDGHYFATAPDFGCSRDYKSRYGAIFALVSAECYSIVKEVKPAA